MSTQILNLCHLCAKSFSLQSTATPAGLSCQHERVAGRCFGLRCHKVACETVRQTARNQLSHGPSAYNINPLLCRRTKLNSKHQHNMFPTTTRTRGRPRECLILQPLLGKLLLHTFPFLPSSMLHFQPAKTITQTIVEESPAFQHRLIMNLVRLQPRASITTLEFRQ